MNKRKKVLIVCLICFFNIFTVFAGDAEGAAITQAAGSGQPLGECSTQSLSEAYNYASSHGYDSEAGVIYAELQAREQRLAMEALIAESEAAEAIEASEKVREELAAAEKELAAVKEEYGLFSDEYKSMKETVQDLKTAVKEAKAVVEEKSKAMVEAYSKLAEHYRETQGIGDPVRVSSGEFMASYCDFIAQDYQEKFTVVRHLNNTRCDEGFGYGWTCSLSSRIIHCVNNTIDKTYLVLKENLSKIENMLERLNAYNEHHPNFPRQEIDDLIAFYNGRLEDYTYLIALCEEEIERNNQNKELNKYVAYGRFSKEENYFDINESIIYVDADGCSSIFYYEGDGEWKALSKIIAADITIRGLNAKGKYSKDASVEGGFEVRYRNGSVKYYSKYGILEKERDRNKNTTTYTNLDGRINQITLKTGEKITVERNSANQITKIEGPVSGAASYAYKNGKLMFAFGNRMFSQKYDYDSESYLTKITKADDTFVQINYRADQDKKYVSSVTNENGDNESFLYDFSDRELLHSTFDGKSEKVAWNDLGNVIYKMDETGSEFIFENNREGLITSQTVNSVKYDYSYNDYYDFIKSENSDAVMYTDYNEGGFVKRQVDADGFYYKYEYDENNNLTALYYCDNLISTCTYYDNGLLKSLYENDCIYNYEYNTYGSLTRKTKIERKNNEEKIYCKQWQYDEKNRPCLYLAPDGEECLISYGDYYRCEIEAGKKKGNIFITDVFLR